MSFFSRKLKDFMQEKQCSLAKTTINRAKIVDYRKKHKKK